MPVGDRQDPYGAYNFLVEIDGITRAGFRECAGLDTTQEVIDYREGADPLGLRKIPGMPSSSNITLARGVTDDAELWEWRKTVMNGSVERKNISIVLLDSLGQEKVRWNLRNCWPSGWTGPSFNAQSSDLAIENLELVYEGVDRA